MQRSFAVITLAAVLGFVPARADEEPLTLLERGRLRRAAAAAESQIKSNASDVGALRVLATVRAVQRHFDEATRFAEQAVTAAPKNADAHYALAQVAGMHAQASSVLKQPGHARRFKKEAEQALSIDPHHEDATEGMIAFYRQAPGIMGGDKKKAATYLDRLMELNPTTAWLTKADWAFDDKDTTAAESYLRKAVAVKGEPRAKIQLATWLNQPWRHPDEAEALAREAVDAEPWRGSGWAVLAMRQAYQKRWADLDATLASAEKALDGNLSAHYQAARVMIIEKLDASRAEELLRRYLKVEPEIGAASHAGAHWRLGQALELQGKKPEAIAELQTAIKLDPKLEGPKKDLKRLKG